MKNSLKIILLLFVNSSMYCQSFSSSSQEHDEIISTNINTTRINLLNIDYNGGKIPIVLSYSHDGIKVSDKPDSGLGMKWRIENIGVINRIVNYVMDEKSNGWFNTQNPSFASSMHLFDCDPDYMDCSHQGDFMENDLSPDFFSLQMSNGVNFDFLYKKSISNGVIGTPIPQFLSNPDGYKINTNFGNFEPCEVPNNNVVFNILDKFGNNYDFVKGPMLNESGRGTGGCRTNFYVKNISNPANSDFVAIDYIAKEIISDKFYSIGGNLRYNPACGTPQSNPNNIFCQVQNQEYDYVNDILRNTSMAYYQKDESRLDIQKIVTNNEIIDFIYTSNLQYLTEIKISDSNGNHISSYYFSYDNFQGTSTQTLTKITKNAILTNTSQVLYEFEYYPGDDFFEYDSVANLEDCGNYEDYFGYYNGEFKQSLYPLPYQRRTSDLSLYSADNFDPNLNYAKHHSLYRIKNKYSGITEFSYQLKADIDLDFGNYYGGGLVISSKKMIPNIGNTSLINYTYHNLKGFVLATSYLNYSYCETYEVGNSSIKCYSPLLKLFNTEETPLGQTGVYSIHRIGNFFENITESIYDFASMTLLSQKQSVFTSNYEGINRTPLLLSEIFKDSAGATVKSIDYTYDYQVYDTIDSAEFTEQAEPGSHMFGWIIKIKTERQIPINRINLIQKKEIQFSPEPIESSVSYTYLNADSKLLRSQSQSTSSSSNTETKYYYATDTSLAGEPFIADLISKNIVGTPLLVQNFIGGEKLAESKTVYEKNASTSNLLEPKFVFAKKGNDTDSTLERKLTYDSYDDKGNLTQYTLENGVPVSMIWGYNKTKLIAKIENIAYASIPSGLITSAQSASNIANNESSILTALNALRADSNLSYSMITTYTHIPLVGVSTVIDPKGDKVVYNYDEFGRIKSVRDKDNNIVTENEYNYKP